MPPPWSTLSILRISTKPTYIRPPRKIRHGRLSKILMLQSILNVKFYVEGLSNCILYTYCDWKRFESVINSSGFKETVIKLLCREFKSLRYTATEIIENPLLRFFTSCLGIYTFFMKGYTQCVSNA